MKHIRLLTFFVSLLTLGNVSYLFDNGNHTKEVEAWYNPKEDVFVDLSLNERFMDDNANPYIHYLVDNEEVNVNLILQNDYVYKVESLIPKEVFSDENNGFEICSGLADEYKSIWISGNNLLKEDNYNYICVDTYVEGSDALVKGYGYYYGRKQNPGATYLTQRIWLKNDNTYFYEVDDWGSAPINVVQYNVSGVYETLEMVKFSNAYDSSTYYYADIPYDISSFSFLRMSNSNNHKYLIYQEMKINQITYGSCYYVPTSSYEDFYNISTDYVYGADAITLSLVVEAYLTYGKADSNGCNEFTVRNLFLTWFKNKSATKDDLKNVKYADYNGYNQQTGSYEGYSKTAYYSVNEKWNTMCSQAGINPDTGEVRGMSLSWFDSDTFKLLAVVGGTTLVIIGAVVVLIVIKKRKED